MRVDDILEDLVKFQQIEFKVIGGYWTGKRLYHSRSY